MRGTTVVWGDYGLRMKDHDRRVSAKQLKNAEETINRRLRGERFKLYKRVSANIGVYTKGSDVRMGKGKGKFDYWAARIAVSRVVFEIKSNLHEQVIRDAFRLAGHKLPGLWEFVKKGDPPMVGITKLGNGVTLESLKAARRVVERTPSTVCRDVDLPCNARVELGRARCAHDRNGHCEFECRRRHSVADAQFESRAPGGDHSRNY